MLKLVEEGQIFSGSLKMPPLWLSILTSTLIQEEHTFWNQRDLDFNDSLNFLKKKQNQKILYMWH
jgi:hypothetical protein